MTKLTDEELSRVLSAHETGDLQSLGYHIAGKPCLLQCAYDIQSLFMAPVAVLDLSASKWFDRNYQPAWTADEFLRQLEAQGIA